MTEERRNETLVFDLPNRASESLLGIGIRKCACGTINILTSVLKIGNNRSMTLVKLTEKQKKLVDTLVATGDSIKNCAKLAGYSEGEAGRVSASKALKTPHVQQYMMTAIADSMSIHATKALSRIVNLSSNAKSEYVSLEASKDLLDRAGFKAPDKVMHSHVGNVNVKIDLS